jgi:serine/threonine-protein kinase
MLEPGDVSEQEQRLNAVLAEELASFFAAKDQFNSPLLSPPPAARATPPATVGGYEVLGEIGRGGRSVVYRARHPELGRVVALEVVRGGPLASSYDMQRFRAEAALVAHLDHPNLVPLFEVGEHAGQPFVAMKLIEGRSLADLLRQGPLDPRPAAWLLSCVARAVDHAHQCGVLHRDLEPGNILLDEQGTPYVAGFALAHLDPELSARLAGRLTPDVDVSALGAILYECLLGRAPFATPTPVTVLRQMLEQEPPAPQTLLPRLDRDLACICLKCLHREPEPCYRSALELAEDLERWLAGNPGRTRPAGLLARLWRWCLRRPGRPFSVRP